MAWLRRHILPALGVPFSLWRRLITLAERRFLPKSFLVLALG
jgi:hypothetical protein